MKPETTTRQQTVSAPVANPIDVQREKNLEEEFGAVLNGLGVLDSGDRRSVLQVLGRWPERVAEVGELWRFLGGGAGRSFTNLEVWGPPGVGKRAVLRDVLESWGIRHLWISCDLFFNIGDLHAAVAEQLQRMADSAVAGCSGEAQQGAAMLRARASLRAIDKVEQAVTGALARIAKAGGVGSDGRVLVIFDKAEKLLNRLGAGALDKLLALPEVLARGSERETDLVRSGRKGVAVVTLSHLPFNRGGKDYVPEVVFVPYAKPDLEGIVERMLSAAGCPALEHEPLPTTLLLALASPWSRDLRVLRNIGIELRRDRSKLATPEDIQLSVQRALEQHLCLGSLDGFGGMVAPSYGGIPPEDPALAAAVGLLTKAEKRLVVATYLAGHVQMDDDEQLFLPRGRRGRGRRKKQRQTAEELPIVARAPRLVPLSRVLAVYHSLARKRMLISGDLLQHVCQLRQVGLIRFAGDRCCLEQDPKVICRADLELVRAFASDLNIQLVEYLADYVR